MYKGEQLRGERLKLIYRTSRLRLLTCVTSGALLHHCSVRACLAGYQRLSPSLHVLIVRRPDGRTAGCSQTIATQSLNTNDLRRYRSRTSGGPAIVPWLTLHHHQFILLFRNPPRLQQKHISYEVETEAYTYLDGLIGIGSSKPS